MIKALQHSNLDKENLKINNPIEDGSMNVPKKTKLYLDFIEREKETSASMNQIFQSDMVRLRYKTLDTYIKILKIGNAPQNYSTSSKIKLAASLQGLGPNFRLNLVVDNIGEEAIYLTDMILDYDYNLFNFEKDFIQLGILIPNVPIKYSMRFRNVSENGTSGNIKIHILDKAKTSPLISTTVKVPISEVDII
jgi:Bardet-Biedl syndrome 1 protein